MTTEPITEADLQDLLAEARRSGLPPVANTLIDGKLAVLTLGSVADLRAWAERMEVEVRWDDDRLVARVEDNGYELQLRAIPA